MALPTEWLEFSPKPRPLVAPDKWNVFLSYRSVNRTWVLNLYDVLHEQGFEVFLDQCVLKAGDELTLKLEEALQTSQAGVLIWSSATRDSDWVAREYQAMERKSKKKKGFCFVPVVLDKSPLPEFAQNRIYLDFSSYPDGPNGGELLRLLHSLVGMALSNEATRFADDQDQAAQAVAHQIAAAIKNRDADDLVRLFEQGGLAWETSSALGCKAAEGLTKLARYSEATGMLEKLQKRFPKAIRLLQLHALALARRAEAGDLKAAQRILGILYEKGERDPETLGIYGRTWMDRYEESKDLNDLRQSRDLYVEAFKSAEDDYYTGINAAAKSIFLGTDADLAAGANYAEQVKGIVGTEPHPKDYWMTATVGEVFLIQKNYADAGRLYEAAVAMARAEIGSHGTTWKQASRLMAKLNPTPEQRAIIRKPFAHLPDADA